MTDLTDSAITARHGLPRVQPRPYEDEEWLRQKYVDEGLTGYEMAERSGVVAQTIYSALDRAGIDRRTPAESRDVAHPSFATNYEGYEVWSLWDVNRSRQVRVHRLAAVAWFGLDAVAGNDVHHELACRWLNTEENLRVVSPSEHMSIERKRNPRERGEDGRFI